MVTGVGEDQGVLINGAAFNFAVLPWGDKCFGKAEFGVIKIEVFYAQAIQIELITVAIFMQDDQRLEWCKY